MLDPHEREAAPGLAELKQALERTLAASRDLIRESWAVRGKLRQTMVRSRALRAAPATAEVPAAVRS
jgi:hypothetical protein